MHCRYKRYTPRVHRHRLVSLCNPLARSLPPSPVLYSLLVHESCTISYSYSVPRRFSQSPCLIAPDLWRGFGFQSRAGSDSRGTRDCIRVSRRRERGWHWSDYDWSWRCTQRRERRMAVIATGLRVVRHPSLTERRWAGYCYLSLFISPSPSLLSHPPLSQSPLAVRSLYVVCQRSAGLCLLWASV